jgi:hypothetical protein
MGQRKFSPRKAILPSAALLLMVGWALTACGAETSTTSSTSTAQGTAKSAIAAPGAETSTTTIETPPPNPNKPVDPPSDACELLDQRLLPTDLRPGNSSSWANERQRVLVDANLSVNVLNDVRDTLPAPLREPLAVERDYAEFVGRTMESATGYLDAIAKLDGYSNRVALASAEAKISEWSEANC